MIDLITSEQAREHLRLDADSAGGPDDAWLNIFIPAISAAVAGWVKEPARLYVPEVDSSGYVVYDSSGEPVPAEPLSPRPEVMGAVLLELSSAYRYREGEGDNDMAYGGRAFDGRGHGYILNRGSTAILMHLRKATVR